MRWMTIKHSDHSTLPLAGGEVFFDGGEQPPSWGRIFYNGKHPSVLVQESSGEENHYPITDYTRWLDESDPTPGGVTAEEIIKPYLFFDIDGMPTMISEGRCLQAMQEYASLMCAGKDAALAEKDKEIAELKEHIEDMGYDAQERDEKRDL